MAEPQAKQWYNSFFAQPLGTGLGIAAVTLSMGFAGGEACRSWGDMKREQYIGQSKVGWEYREADLNGNGKEDKFYFIPGEEGIVFLEIDGRTVLDLAKEYKKLKDKD